MNYDEALEYIHGTLKFGSKLGLENIRILLQMMGNPQRKLKFIHVAGTNGKGSTTAMISQILIESGYKVGMYTSPYIEEFTERIQVNGHQISKEELADITSRVKQIIFQMEKEGHNHPTEFEIVTAIAFQYYYEMQCDYIVIEVGLGGRLDATNVIEEPLISVITSLSLDHMEWLGDTIEKIAYEKCGIIKEKKPVVVYPQQDADAQRVIDNICLQRDSKVFKPEVFNLEIISDTLDGVSFNYKDYKDLNLNIIGTHQVLNAITAITAIEVLNEEYGLSIKKEDIKKALANIYWPGRLEILNSKPLFIIDGAHNISGINALICSLDKYIKEESIIFIVGMLKDKEYEKSLKEISKRADVIIVTKPINPRAVSADDIGRVASNYCDRIIIEEDIQKALEKGIELQNKEGVLCCCGSLYLIGDIRKKFKKTSR